MSSRIQGTPRVRVLLELPDSDQLAEVTVQPDNRDMVRWDRARAAKKWPEQKEAPVLWITFLAWAAIKRLGHDVHTGDYDSFEGRCVEVLAVDENGEPLNPNKQDDELDPTQ